MVQRAVGRGLRSLFLVVLTVCAMGVILGHSFLANRVRQIRAILHKKLASAPKVRLSPAFSDFGIQAVGMSSPQRTMALTNTGTSPLHIHSFAISGGDRDDFGLSQDCPGTLAPGDTCALNPVFTPTAPGPRKSSIMITYNGKASPAIIGLKGAGTTLRPSESRLCFGEQKLGTSSSVMVTTVTNNGGAVLHLSPIAILGTSPGDFTQTTTCGNTLAAGAHCAVSVAFRPVARGARSATLRFSDEGGGSLQVMGLSGMGTGAGQFMTLGADRTHLVNTITNTPVFMTGEDAFALATQLSNTGFETYLADRASRKFNAIWMALADNATQSNAPQDFYAHVPFDGPDFTNFDEAYWSHIDDVIQQAQANGITVMADPGFVGLTRPEGYLNSYLKSSDDVMIAYGRWLGNRYKNYANLIWSLGGDADPSYPGLYTKLNDLASGIVSADANHLITVEASRYTNCPTSCTAVPSGGYSSMDVWSGSAPLNLNWVYNTYSTTQMGCSSNYARPGALPALMGEDWYELEHSMTPLQVREESYWEILSGCTLGRLVGNQAIWSMGGPANTSGLTWESQLASPGSVAEQQQGALMRSREFWKLVPDTNNSVLVSGYGSGNNLSVAARTTDGQTIVAYVPNGNAATLTIDMTKITSPSHSAKCWWFDPRNSSTTSAGSFANTETHRFTPPDSNDWVLVIDDAGAKLPAPGGAAL
jgi:hypothetical protein